MQGDPTKAGNPTKRTGVQCSLIDVLETTLVFLY